MEAWVAPHREILTPTRLRALQHSLWILGIAWLAITLSDPGHWAGFDSHAYWSAWRHHVYSVGPQHKDAFLYSPAFAQAIWPLTMLPWIAFLVIWNGSLAAIYAWLLRPLGWQWGVPIFLLSSEQLLFGNVFPLFALVLVYGFRRPALWAFPLLTKITPAVGILWFSVRREWRPAAIALGTSLAVVALSAAFAPDLWSRWLHLLAGGSSGGEVAAPVLNVPLLPRMLIAVAITAYAARTNRKLLLPVAMCLASPVFGLGNLTLLAAIPRMQRQGGTRRAVVLHDRSRVLPDAATSAVAERDETWVDTRSTSTGFRSARAATASR